MADTDLPSGDPTWSEVFEALIQQAILTRNAVLEGMCEAALVSGKYGVLVEGNHMTLTEDVPYGEIRYRDDDPGAAARPAGLVVSVAVTLEPPGF